MKDPHGTKLQLLIKEAARVYAFVTSSSVALFLCVYLQLKFTKNSKLHIFSSLVLFNQHDSFVASCSVLETAAVGMLEVHSGAAFLLNFTVSEGNWKCTSWVMEMGRM